MNNNTNIKELVFFCQMVSYAYESKLPLAQSLMSAANASEMEKPANWCRQISRKLAEGYPLKDAIRDLSDFDPVLAGLLPLLGESKLISVFETYTRLLIATEIVKNKLQTVFMYPFIILLLLCANLIILNVQYFPEIYSMIVEQGQGSPILLKLLYFAEPSLWPWAIILPVFLAFATFQYFKMLVISNWHSFYNSYIVNLMGFSSYLKTQMTARFQSIIALYLQAGYSVENAIKLAMSTEDKAAHVVNLHRTLHLLENGVAMNLAFEESEVLEYFGTENFVDVDSLPERMLYCSNSQFRLSEKNVLIYSNLAGYMALFLSGIFVLLVTTGFFSSYFFALAGAN